MQIEPGFDEKKSPDAIGDASAFVDRYDAAIGGYHDAMRKRTAEADKPLDATHTSFTMHDLPQKSDPDAPVAGIVHYLIAFRPDGAEANAWVACAQSDMRMARLLRPGWRGSTSGARQNPECASRSRFCATATAAIPRRHSQIPAPAIDHP